MSLPPLSLAARSLRSSAVRDLLRDARLPDMVSLAGGLPDPALFDVEGIEAAWETLRQRGLRDTLQYGQTDGEPGLREALAAWTRLHGTPATADDVLVTTGSQQALDLVARTLLDPGDTVVAESPTYLAALQVFQLAGARLWTLPNDEDGALVESLSSLPADRRPKLVYLVTNFANPSGASLSLERRLALLRWAAEHQVFVLEDDPYGLLRFDGAALPSLRALCSDVPQAAPWVGYASSLSKVLAPGLRLGWVLLPPALRAACVRVKQALDLHTATVTQALAAELLRTGRPREQLPRLQRAYAERRDRLCDAL
jgi:DNA-binding transcriptional MocR family regulator